MSIDKKIHQPQTAKILKYLACTLFIFMLACQNLTERKTDGASLPTGTQDKAGKTDTVKRVAQMVFKNKEDSAIAVFEPYCSFLKGKYDGLLRKNKLEYFGEEDIDEDGHREALIGFSTTDDYEGPGSDDVDKILVLRNVDNHVKVVVSRFLSGEYYVNGIELVQLKGEKQYYIHIYWGGEGAGNAEFKLLKLVNDRLVDFFESHTTTDSDGGNSLEDSDKDGIYDCYIETIVNDEDLFNFEVDKKYEYKNGKFVLSETQVDVSHYPTEIEDVVSQFVSLKLLPADYCTSEVKDRLTELCSDQHLLEAQLEYNKWSLSYNGNHNKNIIGGADLLQIDPKADQASASLFYRKDENDQLKSLAILHLTKSNNKWRITGMQSAE